MTFFVSSVFLFMEVVKGGEEAVSEKELIERIQSGDKQALNILIEQYYQLIFGYYYKATSGDYHQSKDLTQEVFIKMVSSIGKYKNKTEFKNWLFTIASNHLKNYWRGVNRQPVYCELKEEVKSSENNIEQGMEESEIRSALNSLPKEQKEVIILRYYSGFQIKEIAKITKSKESTVKMRIKYAIQKLKKEMEGL